MRNVSRHIFNRHVAPYEIFRQLWGGINNFPRLGAVDQCKLDNLSAALSRLLFTKLAEKIDRKPTQWIQKRGNKNISGRENLEMEQTKSGGHSFVIRLIERRGRKFHTEKYIRVCVCLSDVVCDVN